jgi:uncharacterized protein (TIGR03435 family)
MRLSFQNDPFDAINITLKEILSAMLGFSMSVIVEGRRVWTDTARYDIACKAERDVPVSDRNGAVISLLEDRFKLITHRETKEVRRTSPDGWREKIPRYSARKKAPQVRLAVTAFASSLGV